MDNPSRICVESEDVIFKADFGSVIYLPSNDKVHYGSKEYWNSQPDLIGNAGHIYIYSDHKTDSLGNNFAAIKVGDGRSFLISLPFIDKLYEQHIENGVIHISEQERRNWNSKANVSIDSEDPTNLIITTGEVNEALLGTLKKITFNGLTYTLEDEEARRLIEAIGSPAHFIGQTTTALTDGVTTNPIEIDGEEVTAKNGDIVVYQSQEFIFDGSKWVRLGDFSGLGVLAYKNAVAVTTKATGQISGGDVTLQKTSIGSMSSVGIEPSIVDEQPQDRTKPQPVKFEVSGTKLIISMGTFNAGQMPTKTDVTVATDVDTVIQPTFTGNNVSGTVTYS